MHPLRIVICRLIHNWSETPTELASFPTDAYLNVRQTFDSRVMELDFIPSTFHQPQTPDVYPTQPYQGKETSSTSIVEKTGEETC